MLKFITATLTLSVLVSTSLSKICQDYAFPNGASYDSCLDLPLHGAFIHWNYTRSTSTADLAFRRPGTSPTQWIAWAVNPSGGAMEGSQALVAYLTANGSVHAYTSSVDYYITSLAEGKLSFEVPMVSGSHVNDEMTIFARLQLGSVVGYGATQVWMVGPMTSDGVPGMHSYTGENDRPVLRLMFADDKAGSNSNEGSTETIINEDPVQKSRNVHGVLNAVGWGTLLPIGVLFARYLKVFKSTNKVWFYLHSGCQTAAYAVGVAGWVTGRKLGISEASLSHGTIGFVLFILGTLQVLALLLRPKPDHPLRFCWNVYHYSCGYIIIILSVLNVYKGLSLLDPLSSWKQTYTGMLVFLGSVAVLLEIVTWIIVNRRKRANSSNNLG